MANIANASANIDHEAGLGTSVAGAVNCRASIPNTALAFDAVLVPVRVKERKPISLVRAKKRARVPDLGNGKCVAYFVASAIAIAEAG